MGRGQVTQKGTMPRVSEKKIVVSASRTPILESKRAARFSLFARPRMEIPRATTERSSRRQEYAYRIAAAVVALLLLLTWFSA